MSKYIILTIKWLFLFLIASISIFIIVRLTPGSPVDITLNSMGLAKTPENISAIEELYGFNQSIVSQYFEWIISFIKGDFGKSYLTQISLKHEFLTRLPLTLLIGCGGIILAMFFSFWLGYKSSLKEKGIYNYLSRGLTLFSQTVPIFLLILLTIYFFGVKYHWIKFFKGITPITLFLALSFVALPLIGPMSRTVKGHFIETSQETFMQYYEIRGYEKNKALLKYGSKPALYGLCAITLSKFSSVIGSTAIVEFSFTLAGLNTFLIESLARRDYPVIQDYILVVMIWMFLITILFEWISDTLLKKTRRKNDEKIYSNN
ncbi:ABC transporter permease subunit [Granulicatella sp. zg-ZJ]|uniref:ABC transporter permease n=1 Tax=Granulicatella sp. zg-ZJ TaxID=2678504 RepID=UPI0013D75362|nr:ABC transporter permease [Granulicatella sp. zg-ZJ]MBS4749621.1 ABC transporter permease [Carnobacteriaceae bacterium zg-ZUI78]NEW62407.1 ABC transporter permease subunit [Granulicatella sp. zg-ZJ]